MSCVLLLRNSHGLGSFCGVAFAASPHRPVVGHSQAWEKRRRKLGRELLGKLWGKWDGGGGGARWACGCCWGETLCAAGADPAAWGGAVAR